MILNVFAFIEIKGIETQVKATEYLKNKLKVDNFKVLHIRANRVGDQENLEYNNKIFKDKFIIETQVKKFIDVININLK